MSQHDHTAPFGWVNDAPGLQLEAVDVFPEANVLGASWGSWVSNKLT